MALDLKKIASVPHHELMIADTDDILIVVPEQGFKDTADVTRSTVNALREYAQKLGKRCGLVVIANNLLSQDAESRRMYAEDISPDLFFCVTLVVSSPLARAIGGVAIRLTKMQMPFSLSDTVEAGIAWANAQRKAS
jgi:hypothetical protein